ncbi:hypothetical protein DFS34DRAFT_164264 [Phlyctochytrium arcticum]|nr:hypothetical protein DFS34DRAFT_164264 [Phlyctochytrium arcticum]
MASSSTLRPPDLQSFPLALPTYAYLSLLHFVLLSLAYVSTRTFLLLKTISARYQANRTLWGLLKVTEMLIFVGTVVGFLVLPNKVLTAQGRIVPNIYGKLFAVLVASRFALVIGGVVKGRVPKGYRKFSRFLFFGADETNTAMETHQMEGRVAKAAEPSGLQAKESSGPANVTLQQEASKMLAPPSAPPQMTSWRSPLSHMMLAYLAVNGVYYYFSLYPPSPQVAPSLAHLLFDPKYMSLTNPKVLIGIYMFAFALYCAMILLYWPLACGLALLTGMPLGSVPALHDRPWKSAGLREFWSWRWNLLVREELRKSVYTPVIRALSGQRSELNSQATSRSTGIHVRPLLRVDKPYRPPASHHILATLATFLYSGLGHEYICWSFFGSLTGEQLLFFVLQPVGLLLETLFVKEYRRRMPPRGRVAWAERWLGRLWTFTWLLWCGGLFTNPFVRADILYGWRLVPVFF